MFVLIDAGKERSVFKPKTFCLAVWLDTRVNLIIADKVMSMTAWNEKGLELSTTWAPKMLSDEDDGIRELRDVIVAKKAANIDAPNL